MSIFYEVTWFPKQSPKGPMQRPISSDFDTLDKLREWCRQIGTEGSTFQVKRCEIIPQEEYIATEYRVTTGFQVVPVWPKRGNSCSKD